jgi:dTDP-4-dehydrorhamnose reductase
MTTRWLVTGAGGMLGRDLVATLDGEPVTALTRPDLDVTDPAAVDAAIHGSVGGGDVVLHTAAYTDVDGAETHEPLATAVNGDGARHVAAACARAGAVLVHVSTDYVLPGDASAPYPEDAPTKPVNAYGRSKLAGEQAVLDTLPDRAYVVRTAWLYGEHGRNFVATMLRLAATRDTVDVVDDQRGQPTWSYALAGQLVALGRAAAAGTDRAAQPVRPVPRVAPGVYHGTSAGETTWYGLARAVFAEAGLDPRRVRPTTTAAFPRPAPRPSYSVLSHGRWAGTGVAPLGDWRTMVSTALARPTFAALAEEAR